MSLDKSLRKKSGMAGVRSVLKRGERIAKLKEVEKFAEGGNPFNLPKVRVLKVLAKKAKKAKVEGEEDKKGAKGGKAAPAAKAAAAPAAKPAAKK